MEILTSIYLNGKIKEGSEISDLTDDGTEIVIPSEYEGETIVALDFFALNCENAKKITFPETFVDLSANNFCNCPELEIVDLSKTNIEELNGEIFSDCPNLKTVILPHNLKKINSAFNNCHNLDTVSIPDTVEILEKPFSNCHINNLIFGKNVSTFISGENWTADNIEINKDNAHLLIEDGLIFSADKKELICAFTNLDKVILPNETSIISDNAFSHKTINELDTNNVEVAKSEAFKCAKISKLIANNLTQIGHQTFAGVDVDYIEMKALTYIDNYMFWHTKIGKITLSDNLTTICEGAFKETDINSFKCPKSLSLIDIEAFANSTLESIEFNDTLVEIGIGAFSNCLKAASIYLPNSLKTLGAGAFTYSTDALYQLPKDLEYKDGIYFPSEVKTCKNILVCMTEAEKQSYYSDTNLDDKELNTFQTLEELLEEGVPFKKANDIVKSAQRNAETTR